MPGASRTRNRKRETINKKLRLKNSCFKFPVSSFQFQVSQGFTLLETVISLFLIIAIITILLTSSSVQLASRGSNLQGTAVKIASRQIETLRNTDFSLLPASGAFTDPDLAKLPQGSAQTTIGDYREDPDIKQVTIQVTWVVGGAPKETKLETLIYKNGL